VAANSKRAEGDYSQTGGGGERLVAGVGVNLKTVIVDPVMVSGDGDGNGDRRLTCNCDGIGGKVLVLDVVD